MRRDPFQAIADPTRRAIINMVAKETLNLNSIAGQFNVSRPAISKHIKILAQCGLIEITQKGRERFCDAKLESLSLVSTWLHDHRNSWGGEVATANDKMEAIPTIEEITPVITLVNHDHAIEEDKSSEITVTELEVEDESIKHITNPSSTKNEEPVNTNLIQPIEEADVADITPHISSPEGDIKAAPATEKKPIPKKAKKAVLETPTQQISLFG